MFAVEILKTIAELRSLARLDAIAKEVWTAWGAGAVADDQAHALCEAGTLPFRSKASLSLSGKDRRQEIIGSRKLGPTGTDLYKSSLPSCGRPLTEAAQRPFGRPSAVA